MSRERKRVLIVFLDLGNGTGTEQQTRHLECNKLHLQKERLNSWTVKVFYLQNNPMSFLGSQVETLLCDDFLTLTKNIYVYILISIFPSYNTELQSRYKTKAKNIVCFFECEGMTILVKSSPTVLLIHAFPDWCIGYTKQNNTQAMRPQLTCPSDTLWKFLLSMVKPSFLPRASTSFRGSTPGDRMKKIGVPGPLSSYDFANSTWRFSTYLEPIFSSTKALQKRIVRMSIQCWQNSHYFCFRRQHWTVTVADKSLKKKPLKFSLACVLKRTTQSNSTSQRMSFCLASRPSSCTASARSFYFSTLGEISLSPDTRSQQISSIFWRILRCRDQGCGILPCYPKPARVTKKISQWARFVWLSIKTTFFRTGKIKSLTGESWMILGIEYSYRHVNPRDTSPRNEFNLRPSTSILFVLHIDISHTRNRNRQCWPVVVNMVVIFHTLKSPTYKGNPLQ